jgi:hypothetical protein
MLYWLLQCVYAIGGFIAVLAMTYAMMFTSMAAFSLLDDFRTLKRGGW